MKLGKAQNLINHRFTFTTGAATQEIELWFSVKSPILNASHNGSKLVYDIEPFDIKINNISIAEITDCQGFTADVQTSTMYYPFGMQMPGRVYNTDDYTRGFNGMEKDDEVKGSGNSLDYGARLYDPRLGKWWSIDRLRSMYPSITPFSFAGNSPINFKDPDGNIIVDANGNVIYSSTGQFKRPPEADNLEIGQILEYDRVEVVNIYANDGTAIEAMKIKRVKGYYKEVQRRKADGTTYIDHVFTEDVIDEAPQSSYNCHGFTFANGALWIESHEVDRLLEHDGYYDQIAKTYENAQTGDICVFCNDNYDPNDELMNSNYSHTGVVGKNGKIESKWGQNEQKINTKGELEGKYGSMTEIYSRISNKKLSKEQLKPGNTENGTRELSSREQKKLEKSETTK